MFLLAMLCLAAPAYAEADCTAEYERAADRYWTIVGDILQFKAMFDDYDRLCTRHYPDVIDSLQPAADLLRGQTDRDLRNASAAMKRIFEETLPAAVVPSCREDEKSRRSVQKKFLAAMERKTETLELRLKKSAKTLRSPKENLALCADLQKLKPKIEKVLGQELANPLLEMSVLNRAMTRSGKHDKKALKTYRETLKLLTADEG